MVRRGMVKGRMVREGMVRKDGEGEDIQISIFSDELLSKSADEPTFLET